MQIMKNLQNGVKIMLENDRILIKNIGISDCGSFHGVHNIELSDSTEKNFTIIIGISGMGKSTIFKLIFWCLFGTHYDPKTEFDASDEGIINLDRLKNLKVGENTSSSVSLSIHDQNGEKYVLTRTLTATNHRETNSKKFDSLNNSMVNAGIQTDESVKMKMRNDEGDQIIEKDSRIIKNTILNIFPQNLSDFFLFDGEKLLQFQNKGNAAELIEKGIEKISGLPIVDNLIENAKKTHGAIVKHIADKDVDSSGLAKLLQDTENEIADKKSKLTSKTSSLSRTQKVYDAIIEKIQKNESGEKIQKRIGTLEKERTDLNKIITKNNGKMKDFLFEKIPELLVRTTLEQAEEIFANLEDEDKIPPSISRGAIDKILNSDPLRCICGRPFEKDDDSWDKLDDIKKVIIDDDISQGITQGRGLISQILDRSIPEKVKTGYFDFVETGNNATRSKDKILGELDELNEQMKTVTFDDKENYPEKKRKLWDEISVLNSEITDLKDSLEGLETQRVEREKKLTIRIEHEKVDQQERNKILLIKAVEKFAAEKRSEIVDKLRKKTEDATSKYFLESAPQKELFHHVSISPKYDITACDSEDYVKELSKGQSHVLGLSYVSGCRQITNTNTFLFIDSPLHNISGESRNEISQVLANNLPGVQVVLFVTDSEYTSGDDKGAKPVRHYVNPSNKVWKEYEIQTATTDDGINTKVIKEYKRNE